ncbi:hypothetical protein [Streptomyces sp. CRN 30]|uniref:hypothetical protein n=1 Tax=Streptomyces sp. CRN 30 TaxID=3075613 RepID=UPI002A7F64BC|nr:hypothetical protein [Streptomyces sp. CRN 30]
MSPAGPRARDHAPRPPLRPHATLSEHVLAPAPAPRTPPTTALATVGTLLAEAFTTVGPWHGRTRK